MFYIYIKATVMRLASTGDDSCVPNRSVSVDSVK